MSSHESVDPAPLPYDKTVPVHKRKLAATLGIDDPLLYAGQELPRDDDAEAADER